MSFNDKVIQLNNEEIQALLCEPQIVNLPIVAYYCYKTTPNMKKTFSVMK